MNEAFINLLIKLRKKLKQEIKHRLRKKMTTPFGKIKNYCTKEFNFTYSSNLQMSTLLDTSKTSCTDLFTTKEDVESNSESSKSKSTECEVFADLHSSECAFEPVQSISVFSFDLHSLECAFEPEQSTSEVSFDLHSLECALEPEQSTSLD